jgi:hypothetical protein
VPWECVLGVAVFERLVPEQAADEEHVGDAGRVVVALTAARSSKSTAAVGFWAMYASM